MDVDLGIDADVGKVGLDHLASRRVGRLVEGVDPAREPGSKARFLELLAGILRIAFVGNERFGAVADKAWRDDAVSGRR